MEISYRVLTVARFQKVVRCFSRKARADTRKRMKGRFEKENEEQ